MPSYFSKVVVQFYILECLSLLFNPIILLQIKQQYELSFVDSLAYKNEKKTLKGEIDWLT